MVIGIVLAATPGYSETFFRSKIEGLQKKGHRVLLFVQRKDPTFSLCEVRVAPKVYSNRLLQFMAMLAKGIQQIGSLHPVIRFWKLQRKSGSSLAATLKSCYLNAHILSTSVDWLHFGFATMALGKEQLPEAIGAKMAVSFRGFDINVYPIKHPDCYKTLFKKVDKVHSISNYLLQQAYRLGLSTSVPYQIITPAVDLQKLPSHDGPSAKQWVLATVARLHWIKGLETALKAVQILHQQGCNITYHIIGDGDRKNRERYQFLVQELGIEGIVVFHGRQSHAATLAQMAMSSLYVQPSLNEGFCNAVLEAQGMGLLTVASKVGGLPENIEDEKTGWLVPSNNSEALAQKIREVMELPKEVRDKIRMQATHRVQEQFGILAQQTAFQEFYKEL